MKNLMRKLEELMEIGGTKKDITFLIISGIALLCSIFDFVKLPFDASWVAIILCGIPIILEAVIGLVTEFDIKADVLVSLALLASVFIGEDFAAGEVAFIMQIGSILELCIKFLLSYKTFILLRDFIIRNKSFDCHVQVVFFAEFCDGFHHWGSVM